MAHWTTFVCQEMKPHSLPINGHRNARGHRHGETHIAGIRTDGLCSTGRMPWLLDDQLLRQSNRRHQRHQNPLRQLVLPKTGYQSRWKAGLVRSRWPSVSRSLLLLRGGVGRVRRLPPLSAVASLRLSKSLDAESGIDSGDSEVSSTGRSHNNSSAADPDRVIRSPVRFRC